MQGQLDTDVAPSSVDARAAVAVPEGVAARWPTPWQIALRHFMRNRMAVIGAVLALGLIAAALAAPLIAPHDPDMQFDGGLTAVGQPLAPGAHFLLGTDTLGRDVESRVIYGARVSLLIGTLANGLAMAIGVALGAAAAFFGGAVQTVIMRLTDVMMSFPLILLLIALAVILQPSIGVVIFILAVGGWTGTARLVHGEVVSLKEKDFIAAAHAVGASNSRIVLRHILPHLVPSIIVWTMLGIAPTIMAESSLSFLGIGVQAPTSSWGNMISEGQNMYQTAPWLLLVPGLALMLTVVSFNLVGDGARDALYAGGGRA